MTAMTMSRMMATVVAAMRMVAAMGMVAAVAVGGVMARVAVVVICLNSGKRKEGGKNDFHSILIIILV